MIRFSKQADERREAGPMEVWCLHGAVGVMSDWRTVAGKLADRAVSTRAVDLWRFLETPMPMLEFAAALNNEPGEEVFRGTGRALMGYSMGGRLALHALLEKDHPWAAAIIIGGHPGLEDDAERAARRASDTQWATRAFAGDWDGFLGQWNAQPLLGGSSIRAAEEDARLAARRQEIARSFVDWSLAAQEPLWDQLGEITVPVLWIAGEHDGKFRAIAERAAALTPRSSLAIAPGAGHRVPWDAPDWLAETAATFLQTGELS